VARRTLPLAAALALLLAACTTNTASTTSVPLEPLNRLVILDGDGSVVTIRPDGTDAVTIAQGGRGDALFSQPLWSPSSDRIAWSQVTADGFALGLTDDAGEIVTVPMPDNPFYLYWSPDDRWIGALHNAQTGGIDLEMVDAANQTTSIVANGAPFYFSWNAGASQVVAHIEDRRFELIDVSGEVIDLGLTGPSYQTPQWTEAGVFHLRGSDLVRFEPEGDEETVATVSGPSTFVANGPGSRIAVQAFGSAGGIAVGLEVMPAVPSEVLVVLDVGTGDVHTVTDQPAIAYFWSPDGENLLVFEPGDDEGTLRLAVWSDEEFVEMVTYTPHPTFLNQLLPFFTQYAQSIQLWSPDSSSVAFAGSIDDQGGIWVHAVSGEEPRLVSDGSWVVWSTR
jgi:TolB protein